MASDEVLIGQHQQEKEDSRRFKDRRTSKWNEIYHLYRDKVQTNRLTQRQSVNIPIIRDTVDNWISKIDEEPMLTFEARGREDRDKQGEVYVNEMWDLTYDQQSLDLKDNLDKKNVGLMGRSFKYWSFKDGMVQCEVIDPYDVDIDPRVNPFDMEGSASFINLKNRFVPLRRVLANKTFSDEGKRQLKAYLDMNKGGVIRSNTDEEYAMKQERLNALGVSNYDEMRATDILVELNLSHKLIWDGAQSKFVRHLIVFAMDNVILYNKPCEKAYGIDYTPLTSWASDPDGSDFWSDGKGDNVLTMNKVVNMYFSQDLENRAYRNFGMYFYDTLNGTFQPQGWEARPFGMFGVPGNPSEVLQQMRIEPLQDTMPTISFLQELIQSSVAQTPTERGVQNDDTTLGEVQLSLQQSQTRQQVVAKQYRKSWEESGKMWFDLMNANQQGKITLRKRGANGEMYQKTITPSMWRTPEGYDCKVQLKSEREANDDVEFKKNQFVKQSFAQNPVAQKIAKRKELELIGWSPDEVDETMQYEEQLMGQTQQQGIPQPGQDPAQQLPEEVSPATV